MDEAELLKKVQERAGEFAMEILPQSRVMEIAFAMVAAYPTIFDKDATVQAQVHGEPEPLPTEPDEVAMDDRTTQQMGVEILQALTDLTEWALEDQGAEPNVVPALAKTLALMERIDNAQQELCLGGSERE